MTRDQIKQQMSIEEALQVLINTNCYGTMDIAKAVIIDYVKEQEGKKEKVSDEVIKAAAVLLKVNCSKTRYCFDCLFHVDHSDQGGGCFCGCKIEHGISDFSGQIKPKNWEV